MTSLLIITQPLKQNTETITNKRKGKPHTLHVYLSGLVWQSTRKSLID